jgi:hypothetical protein
MAALDKPSSQTSTSPLIPGAAPEATPGMAAGTPTGRVHDRGRVAVYEWSGRPPAESAKDENFRHSHKTF